MHRPALRVARVATTVSARSAVMISQRASAVTRVRHGTSNALVAMRKVSQVVRKSPLANQFTEQLKCVFPGKSPGMDVAQEHGERTDPQGRNDEPSQRHSDYVNGNLLVWCDLFQRCSGAG